jgi:FdhE protein
MAASRVQANPWAAPRQRAETLLARYDFAAEVLTLYLALLEVWEESWAAARAEQPADLAGWAARRVLPAVLAATADSGPKPLVESLFPADVDGAGELLAAWLAGAELVPVERYLARATLRGPLEAVDAGVACAADPAPRGDRRCPRCGGPPQLSFRSDTGDHLVSGHRQLLCARCGESWSFSSTACAYCGEAARRTVYTEAYSDVAPAPRIGRSATPREQGAGLAQISLAEQRDGPQVGRLDPGDVTFPHLRVEACASCQRYLIDVDLGRDPRAVPEVDELAALPLDLYATEHGFSKITPNVMGV